MKITLEKFAKDAGVVIVDCDPKRWGGAFGYTTKDNPRSTVCGCKTKEATYKLWLVSVFGKRTSKALMKLLDKKP